MSGHIKRLVFSILFLFVFFVKMGISIAPLLLSIDKETVSAVIMQLELENSKDTSENAKDLQKVFKKGSELNLIYEFAINPLSEESLLKYHFNSKEYTTSFYPSVPTPPPNKS